MQIPKRRAQTLKKRDEEGVEHLTAAGIERLKRELKTREDERPAAIDDVQRLAQLGDFSENAEYQEAKFRLRRINDRIVSIKDRLMRAVVIDEGGSASGRVAIGSTVVVVTGGLQKTYKIVGPRETDPSRGRISYLSPLGAALINGLTGSEVRLKTQNGEATYLIIEIT